MAPCKKRPAAVRGSWTGAVAVQRFDIVIVNECLFAAVCKSIVHEIETQLNSTENDYELDVVYRISEEKKKVKFSRSETRILEVLDDICDSIPLKLPSTTKKSKNILNEACIAFVGEYEDELTHVFFNNFSPARDRMCADTLQVCGKVESADEKRQEL